MKRNKKDFFQQMKYNKIDDIQKRLKIFEVIVYVLLIAFLLLIELMVFEILQFSKEYLVLGVVILLAFIIMFVCYTGCIFSKNAYYFKNGDMSSGIKNYVTCGGVVYIILLIFYFSINESEIKEFIASLFVPVTTVLAAVLAIMGVHYTHTKQQKNLIDKNQLIFIDKDDNNSIQIYLNDKEKNCKFDIIIYNVSDNYGYFEGVYKISGDELFKIGEDFNYQPILPHKSYKIKNIPYFSLDEELFLIYKDISDNFYYISFLQTNGNTLKIKCIDKCDMDFVNQRIDETDCTYKSIKNESIDEANETTEILEDDFRIKQQKQATKPIRTILIDSYELVVGAQGEILTDTILLTKLKKERSRLAKENKVKPYIVFNNQQLVAIATYKPKNKEEFIAIYGLGERKYELYGKEIIEKFKDMKDS